MSCLLAGIPMSEVSAYLDDILIATATEEQHLLRLREVLDRIRDYGFVIKTSKCKFMFKELPILGATVSSEGIRMSPEQIEAIQKLPAP